ncbi:hypothetical protein XTPLMG728_1793 [Xanthomonas translucens pv. poae]|uniref:Uncharacterized protein n=1 Tax=Xanthomonas graminis pv. poae TaxID=227946 RepID=A0A0K2ZSW2_9XANT|nr:hypothetical protein [Xanthomonas translucens]UKE60550.1 hypothetical protein KM539_11925 [Xanthomonas translucens pv. poae]CTP88097.1 hypothetical protein XTPLMG728_1793 [Xanthomonas translucens pv. poae]
MSDQIRESSRKTAPNVRLVDPLKTQAAAKAKDLGISLNALVSLAVRQYIDGQAAPSQPSSDDVLAQTLFAALDQALACPSPQRRAPRQPAALAVGGRGARLPIKTVKRKGPPRPPFAGFRRRHGSELETFLTCPARSVPSGLVGAGFQQEYERSEGYAELFWRTYIQDPQGL